MVRALVPWTVSTPRVFDRFRREMDQLMEQFFSEEDGGEGMQLFSPHTNIAETENEYEVTVDLPGMKPDEFNVELKENQLWITGRRNREKEEKGKTFHRIERQYGEFRRAIPFPEAVDSEKVDAEYKDGILRVKVAKDRASKPKKIEVKAE
jgi:HSP20 family protein